MVTKYSGFWAYEPRFVICEYYGMLHLSGCIDYRHSQSGELKMLNESQYFQLLTLMCKIVFGRNNRFVRLKDAETSSAFDQLLNSQLFSGVKYEDTRDCTASFLARPIVTRYYCVFQLNI